MSTSHSLQASLLVAALMAFGTAHAADNMSKADYKAEKDRIASTYKTDKDACGKMSGNAKDVCVEEAKAKEKIAKAEEKARRLEAMRAQLMKEHPELAR